MDVVVKFGDSRSIISRDIRVAHFMMKNDERRTTADEPCGNRRTPGGVSPKTAIY